MAIKADADAIIAHIRELPRTAALDGSRRWWPKYVYHSAHVENAARILNSGRVLSRKRAQESGQLVLDCASPDIVSRLTPKHRRWVRLYFRPRAPTQYANEGVRPANKYEYGAHMPVPVYFLFAAQELLIQRGVHFTHGRLHGGAAIDDSAEFLRSMPFKDVYHDGGVGPVGSPRRSDILNARHSEVLVPDELALDSLRLVLCRSKPERETLLALMGDEARKKWARRIAVQTHQNMFHKRGTFIASVELLANRCSFDFYTLIPRDFRGPFEIEFKWKADDGWRGRWTRRDYEVPTSPMRFRLDPEHPQYNVAVRMDGNLVYLGRYSGATTGPELF